MILVSEFLDVVKLWKEEEYKVSAFILIIQSELSASQQRTLNYCKDKLS